MSPSRSGPENQPPHGNSIPFEDRTELRHVHWKTPARLHACEPRHTRLTQALLERDVVGELREVVIPPGNRCNTEFRFQHVLTLRRAASSGSLPARRAPRACPGRRVVRPSIGWLPIGSAFTAEIMAAPGYDTMTIDVRHGAPRNALDFPRWSSRSGACREPTRASRESLRPDTRNNTWQRSRRFGSG